MDSDLLLTVGIVIAVLTIPTMLAGWVDGRAPRMGTLMVVLSAALLIVAWTQKPGGYRPADIPGVMLSVAARYLP
ncbi:hypothetical protein M3484_14005 [Pseudomonas sp. GX19020]|uniref:hypothetical protein n=1 Tax=Pseudomonadota TaxID=1224 RepID=UPI0008952A4E|nr:MULTISPECIES: hypothetical protein [Pseudomonadota]MCL4067687.1 hypothetical protein [Pseudomonas sp. GX19020]SEC51930.1 hypothetical protein SAMN05519105_2736 [Rhodobacter sp. 24-YEA-8]